jgi:glycosyltransferase involved in cell wall biosynthesis
LSSIEYVYSTEADISIDSGAAINEREFVQALLKDFSEQVVCVVPYPKRPEVIFDPRVEYVFPHRSTPFRYVLYSAASFVRIWRVCRAHNVKALAFRLGLNPLVPLLLSWLLREPLFLKTFVGHITLERRGQPWTARALAAALRPLTTVIAQRALAVDTVSAEFMDWTRFRYGVRQDRLHLIPNGANTDFFSPGDTASCRTELHLDHFSKIIGFVGAFRAVYRVDDLIRCMPAILELGNVGLVLVGDGPERASIEARVRSLGLKEHVVFTGKVPYKEVAKHMCAFDIGLDLSLVPVPVGGKVLYTHVSQKVAQYLACGLPVVAYDTLDNRFLVEERIGNVAPAGDISRLAEAIRLCLSVDGDEASELRKRARAYAEAHLSATVVAEQRLAMWRAALSSQLKEAVT